MQVELQRHILGFVKSLEPVSRLLIAFSGGLDSSVLLHALTQLAPQHQKPLLALHINHQIHPDASHWADHCQAFAESLNVDCEVQPISLGDLRSNLEARAREGRYAALFAVMRPGDLLLTAHHEDDQAETLILNLMRGSGLDGLSAMAELQTLANGSLARPLLGFSRKQLEIYARHYQLDWIEDPSNSDTNFDRNFIRQAVMPLLTSRWPHAANSLARSARHSAGARRFIETRLRAQLAGLALKHRLPLSTLTALPPYEQQMLLRFWLRENAIELPGLSLVQAVIGQLADKPENSRCLAQWKAGDLYYYDDALFVISPVNQSLPDTLLTVQPGQSGYDIQLAESSGYLHLSFANGMPVSGLLTVSYRKPGMEVRLQGRQGRRKLKKLLQDWQVPVWARPLVPLVFIDGHCLAIGDLALCDKAAAYGLQSVEWSPPQQIAWQVGTGGRGDQRLA